MTLLFQLLLLSITCGIYYFFIVSINEREKTASLRSGLAGLLFIILTVTNYLWDYPYKDEISGALSIIVLALIILLLLPIKGQDYEHRDTPESRLDERDVMFSRYELKPETERFNEHYERRPEHKAPDNKFRSRPGLLKPGSAKYDPIMFASAEASFFAVDELANVIDGAVSENKVEFGKEEITNYLRNWTKHLGAMDVGFTLLKDYHLYSHAGRKERYGNEIKLDHKYAIAFTVEMNYDMVKAGPDAPIVMESAKQYLNAGAIAVQLAAFIRNLGYPALAHIDANYQVVCPLVAKDAGLGEIGRMGLLMTGKLGPRVRLGVVTTDLPLDTNRKTQDDTILDFCTRCKKCADVCPSGAISHEDREEIDGTLRWQISQEDCFTYWCTSGTDCGRCVSVCPYSHPDNLLHNIVRWEIKNSAIFRKFAVLLDDLIYGRKPVPGKPLSWMRIKSKDKFTN